MRNIIHYPDKRLTAPCETIDRFDNELKELSEELTYLMYKTEGVGFAASQIGVNKKVCICEFGGKFPHTLINPVLTLSGERITSIEGCLSLPGIEAKLKCRYNDLIVDYHDLEGHLRTMRLVVRDAIICQHETDHTNSITLFERMDPTQRRMKLKKYMKSRK